MLDDSKNSGSLIGYVNDYSKRHFDMSRYANSADVAALLKDLYAAFDEPNDLFTKPRTRKTERNSSEKSCVTIGTRYRNNSWTFWRGGL